MCNRKCVPLESPSGKTSSKNLLCKYMQTARPVYEVKTVVRAWVGGQVFAKRDLRMNLHPMSKDHLLSAEGRTLSDKSVSDGVFM